MNFFNKKSKNILTIILSIGLILCLLYIGINKKEKDENKINDKIITNKIESVKEITSLKYSYTNMGQFENSNKFYGYDIPFTQKKFIVAYDGVINFGVDLSTMDINIDSKNINIVLENSKVLSHEIYEDSLKIFDQKTSIFNPIKVEDYNDFSKKQKKNVEQKAIEKGFLKEANKKCEEVIKEILNVDANLKKYKVNITFK